jgi:hypothetical protein
VKTPLVLLPVAALALVAGCGGSKDPAGHDIAAKACQSTGATAAGLARQAAGLNSIYNSLAADEASLAAQEAQGGGVLGSGAAAALTLAPGADIKVISDCAGLGLPAAPPH